MYMSLLPSFTVQMKQHKEHFQWWLDAVSTFGTSWLISAAPDLLASPWCLHFAFGLPLRKASRQLHVPGINLGTRLEENMSRLCSSV